LPHPLYTRKNATSMPLELVNKSILFAQRLYVGLLLTECDKLQKKKKKLRRQSTGCRVKNIYRQALRTNDEETTLMCV
jgi:hypothetical protein